MKNRSIYIIGFVLLGLGSFSCTKDFEEINTNPNGFTTASDGSLFNGVLQSLSPTWNEQFYIHNEIYYKQTQLAALTAEAWGNASIGIEDIWANYYTVLPEVRELEKRFASYSPSTPGLKNMQAMLKIVRAYKTFRVTDQFGDIPFSEAGYGFQDLSLLHPKYDKQRDVYIALLEDLRWADENINLTDVGEPYATFSGFDNLFNGNLTDWRKFANSLRLRYAMRVAEKEPQLAGDIIKDVIDNNKPVFVGYTVVPVLESACIWPALNGFKNNSVSWSFREHKNLRMGSNIFHQLASHDSADGSGIYDPRAWIFFEGNRDNKWVAYPNVPDANTPASTGIPYGAHRDDAVNYSFKGVECPYSPFNYFLIADEDYIPIILITGAEVHFIKAEALFRGIGVTQDKTRADIEYMNGINASVEWWTMVANNSKLPISKLEFPDMVHIPANLGVASVLNRWGSWNASSEQQKLDFIYTQRYIDNFRQVDQAFAELRRVSGIPREGNTLNYFRLPYPQSEYFYNTANVNEAKQRQGGDAPEVKIWWMP